MGLEFITVAKIVTLKNMEIKMELYYIYDVKKKHIYDCKIHNGKEYVNSSVVFYKREDAEKWAKNIKVKIEIRSFELV